MKNLFLVMAASLFGLSASAQVLITDAEYLSRRTERVEARAARNSADLKRMDSIVMSKGYRFVPDQFQQMPAGVAGRASDAADRDLFVGAESSSCHFSSGRCGKIQCDYDFCRDRNDKLDKHYKGCADRSTADPEQ